MTFTLARSFALALAAGAVGTLSLISGCVSEEDPPAGTGGSTATGGSGTSGSTANGGSGGATGGAGGAAGDPLALACPTPTAALITDFSTPSDATNTGVSFGDALTMFSGATFHYPSGTQAYPLVADVSKGDWNVSGPVGGYSGLGISTYLLVTDSTGAMVSTGCTKINASAYKGISFKISGSLPAPGGAGSAPDAVTFLVGTANNDVSSAWLNAHKENATDADVHNFGRCTPVGTTPNAKYDGTCKAPSKVITVTTTPTVIEVTWAQLTGGLPSATVAATEIVSMNWVLPNPTGVGTPTATTYPGSITIDDLKFIE